MKQTADPTRHAAKTSSLSHLLTMCQPKVASDHVRVNQAALSCSAFTAGSCAGGSFVNGSLILPPLPNGLYACSLESKGADCVELSSLLDHPRLESWLRNAFSLSFSYASSTALALEALIPAKSLLSWL